MTIFSADALLATTVWTEAAKAWRFPAVPSQEGLRPAARTCWHNLTLAGDWPATGLPATIEGAIRSGFKAADTLMNPSMESR